MRDESGRLLLGAGQHIRAQGQLEILRAQPLFACEAESAVWHRRLGALVDDLVRRQAPLHEVGLARPEPVDAEVRLAPEQSLAEQWDSLAMQLDAALRDAQGSGGDALARMESVRQRARQLLRLRNDGSLYHLVYAASDRTEKYSSRHSLLTLLICELAAPLLGWSSAWIDSLGRAALSMNLAMLQLQDQLAASTKPVGAQARGEIDTHAQRGAESLLLCGMDDALAVAVVRLHHSDGPQGLGLAALPTEQRLARMLHRADVVGAKISRRASREPMSAVQAARDACLGEGGVPDEIGSALLKAVGLYPPGSFVALANGEVGIVVARGRRANLPHVASLVARNGDPLGEPVRRDTVDRRYAVKAAVAPRAVKVHLAHERLLVLR